MKNIFLQGRRIHAAAIRIGNEGDNRAEHIRFVLPAHLESAAVFLHLRIGSGSDVVELDAERTWVPERRHTQLPGKWTAWLQALQEGDVVWHSDPFILIVGDLPDQGELLEQQYPTAVEEALRAADLVTGLDAKAVTLEPGSAATVHVEKDENGRRVMVYGIPRGRDGNGSVDGETLVAENGILRVNTADHAEAGNTRPITSAAVQRIVGSINAILESI